MPVKMAANRGGSVVTICNTSPVAHAIAATTAGLNHRPLKPHSSPNAHHNKPHDANPTYYEKKR